MLTINRKTTLQKTQKNLENLESIAVISGWGSYQSCLAAGEVLCSVARMYAGMEN